MSDIRGRIAECFANVFPGLPAPEVSKASILSLARWDSVAHVTLLSAIGEEFSLDISPEDFEELTSFELIVDFVKSQIKHA